MCEVLVLFAFFLAILFPLSCEFSLSMLYPMLSHHQPFLAAIFPPCLALSAVCVFAPSAFVACLVACATVCVHLLDKTTRRHRTNYFPPKLQPQQVSSSLER